ncbi:hypothetical protein AVEN_75609-1 [Araneus ventricosus]|uniref:Uncharacterized protein n=1 Tax=Araneus ventricosus TaxID=182803 RepID=A0A4Y2CLQ0_ARAVE|nr:hypothetical protein AVEN_75609-1 [Araneus ventricosus]
MKRNQTVMAGTRTADILIAYTTMVLGTMIGEDLKKFSCSRIIRTIAISSIPIRNLPDSQHQTSYSTLLLSHVPRTNWFSVREMVEGLFY